MRRRSEAWRRRAAAAGGRPTGCAAAAGGGRRVVVAGAGRQKKQSNPCFRCTADGARASGKPEGRRRDWLAARARARQPAPPVVRLIIKRPRVVAPRALLTPTGRVTPRLGVVLLPAPRPAPACCNDVLPLNVAPSLSAGRPQQPRAEEVGRGRRPPRSSSPPPAAARQTEPVARRAARRRTLSRRRGAPLAAAPPPSRRH